MEFDRFTATIDAEPNEGDLIRRNVLGGEIFVYSGYEIGGNNCWMPAVVTWWCIVILPFVRALC